MLDVALGPQMFRNSPKRSSRRKLYIPIETYLRHFCGIIFCLLKYVDLTILSKSVTSTALSIRYVLEWNAAV